MLLVVMVVQHFPDRIAITLVKQAGNAPPFRWEKHKTTNAESPDKYRAEWHT